MMYQTKEDLLELLQKIPGNPVIILSKDSEGNGYSPFSSYSNEYLYSPTSTSGGEIYHSEDSEDGEIPENAIPCLVLWPIN